MKKLSSADSGDWISWLPLRYAIVTAIGLAPAIALAQTQSARISRVSVAPYQKLQRLDALPQMRIPGAMSEPLKPLRIPVDQFRFAAQKSTAKAARFAPNQAIAGAPSQPPGAPPQAKQIVPQTVNPPEIVFNGISNATCANVNGGFIYQPSDMALAVGDTFVGVLQGVNNCISVFDKNGNQQAGYPKSTPTFFSTILNTSDPRMIYDWINHRYYFVIITYPDNCGNGCPGAAFYNLAVSTGDDPTGGWCTYQINVATSPIPSGAGPFRYALPDYPRLGQDRQAVYLLLQISFRPALT